MATSETSSRRRRYPWKSLEVGQKFFVVGRTPTQLASARNHAQRSLGVRFKTRVYSHGGKKGTLVERVE